MREKQHDFKTPIMLAVIKIIGSLFCSLTEHPLNLHFLGKQRHRQVKWLIQSQGGHLIVSQILNLDLLCFCLFVCFIFVFQCFLTLAINKAIGQKLSITCQHFGLRLWAEACIPVIRGMRSLVPIISHKLLGELHFIRGVRKFRATASRRNTWSRWGGLSLEPDGIWRWA